MTRRFENRKRTFQQRRKRKWILHQHSVLALPSASVSPPLVRDIGLNGAVGKAMEAIGRQPEATGKIQTAMIIGAALIEALTIYAFVTVFLLMGKIQ